MNIHGAIDLETGMTRMREVLSVDADSTVALLLSIEAAYPAMRRIHVSLDSARCHHARTVQGWMKQPGRRVVLQFIPAYCPHLDPIERLWGSDARERDARSVLRDIQGVLGRCSDLPDRDRAEELRPLLKQDHR